MIHRISPAIPIGIDPTRRKRAESVRRVEPHQCRAERTMPIAEQVTARQQFPYHAIEAKLRADNRLDQIMAVSRENEPMAQCPSRRDQHGACQVTCQQPGIWINHSLTHCSEMTNPR